MILKGPGLLPDEMWPAREPLAAHRFIQLSDGERARIIESGVSGGPPVLFLHGWGASAYQFRRNIVPIGQAGYRAIAVDLRGHGLSDKPLREGAYTLESMCAHVLRIMDALELDRLPLVGESMSGRIAVELGLTSPDRVERLAVLDPVGLGVIRVLRVARLLSFPLFDPIMPHLVRRAVIKLALKAIYGTVATVSEEDVEEYWAPARFPSFARAMARLLREFSWEPLTEERLRELRQPALVMFGTLDKLVRVDREGALLRERDGYSVRFLEGAGHLANEEVADEVNAALLAFLAGEEMAPTKARAAVKDEVDEQDAGSEEREASADDGRGRRPDGDGVQEPSRSDEQGQGQRHEPSSGRKKRRRRKQRQRNADEET